MYLLMLKDLDGFQQKTHLFEMFIETNLVKLFEMLCRLMDIYFEQVILHL